MRMKGRYPYIIKQILLSGVQFVEEYYPRAWIREERVEFLMELYSEEDNDIDLPEVVWDDERQCHIVIDGWHRIRALISLGKTHADARIMEIPKDRWFAEAGLLNSMGPTQMTRSEYREWICGMFERGIAAEIIAEDYAKRSVRSIRRIVKSLRDETRKELEQKVRELLESGLSYREVAKELDIPKSQIFRICKSDAKSPPNEEFTDCPETDKVSVSGQSANQNMNAQPSFDPAGGDHQLPDPDSEAGRAAISEADKINEINEMFPSTDSDMTDDEVLYEFGMEPPASKPNAEVKLLTAPKDRKTQLEMQFPHQMIRFKSVKEWPEEGKLAARVLELTKFYKQDMDIIQEDTGKDPAFIKKVVMAAVKLMCTSGSNEDMFKVAGELKSFDLVPYIHGAILAANTCAPIAPHMPDWIKKNFSEQDIIALAYLLDVTRPNLFKILRGEQSQTTDATNLVAEMPPKISEAYSVSQKLLREIRDTVRSSQYASDVHANILKENNKTLSITNEIYLCMRVKTDDGHSDDSSDLAN